MSLFRFMALAGALGAVSCGAVKIKDLESPSAIEVRVDANAKSFVPNVRHKLKFYVDITNKSGRALSLAGLRIELRAVRGEAPEAIGLRQVWTYNH